MKAYKGFNKDMTCRGFQYEEGKTYETDEAVLCKKGFHACLNPIDVTKFYNIKNSVFHEVEIDEIVDQGKYSKVVTKKITIGKELSIKELVDEQNKINEENNLVNTKNITENDNLHIVAGKGSATQRGEDIRSITVTESGIATTEHCGISIADWYGVAISGYEGVSITKCSGYAKTGNCGIAFSYNGIAASGQHGYSIANITGTAKTGRCGVAAGAIVEGGNKSVCIAYIDNQAGEGNTKAKAGIGSIIIFIDKTNLIEGEIKQVIRIDGETYKPDTWYTYKDNEVVEYMEKDNT